MVIAVLFAILPLAPFEEPLVKEISALAVPGLLPGSSVVVTAPLKLV